MPAGAMVALKSFAVGCVVAIVGGYDKKLPLESLCEELSRRCKAIVATGQVRFQIAEGLKRFSPDGRRPPLTVAARFDDAVRAALRMAGPGDIVLLSPACASYDQFTSYVERGLRFQRLVSEAIPQTP